MELGRAVKGVLFMYKTADCFITKLFATLLGSCAHWLEVFVALQGPKAPQDFRRRRFKVIGNVVAERVKIYGNWFGDL